ncbi:MAG: hypothetical protein KJ601_07290 [Nanoarchaeota archaeon]|nr:hypothetical protein [Nanoarchaeota archaeon]MBU1704263.1 hypothetical protein [Nanoarchaeota archaeon]
MHQIIKENITKNLLLASILGILYPIIHNFLSQSSLFSDKSASGSIIVVTSIIAVTACFGNFAFTYEKINVNDSFQRYLAHITTGLLMLVIGISLIFTLNLTAIIMGPFIILEITLLLLYLACVGYDFWDVYRVSL